MVFIVPQKSHYQNAMIYTDCIF